MKLSVVVPCYNEAAVMPETYRRIKTVAEALRMFRPLRFIEPPATLDGGDVLCLGKRVFVGLSSRTNLAADPR